MHTNLHRKVLAASLALLLSGFAATSFAGDTTPATDVGAAPPSQLVHVTLMLKLRQRAALEQFVQQTATQGSPNFQKFLTTSEFASRYGATDAQIAKVQAFLKKQGLTGEVLANHMAIQTTGTISQFSHIFQTTIHDYVSRRSGRRFHRPTGSLLLPSDITDSVGFVIGLSNERRYKPHITKAPAIAGNQLQLGPRISTLSKAAGSNPTATGQPGDYTVGDVANFYNVNPLYQHGITGQGATIGVVTLANFLPADAEAYWSDIGLATKPNRITQVHVDGGADFGAAAGSLETSLDVEQSGGMAPNANIIVYDAPNTNEGFVDVFLQAVTDNKADSISVSWGGAEIYNFAALNITGARINDTRDVGDLRALDQIFLEAAAQGQSMFAASGDNGAYDTSGALPTGTDPGTFNAPLTVDSPASDPYITAAGGTTVPYRFSFHGGPVDAITQESVWGWDYIQNYFDTNFGPGLLDLFSAGGGGGVSVYWPQPWYQWFTRGTESSQRKQALVFNDPQAGPTTLLKLPANFRGRNVPDISLNADPETGYIVISSADGGFVDGYGGTSFVAPQLNGISALLTQSLGHRVGFWNPHAYLLQLVFGTGKYSAFNDIRAGDNWFYHGEPGFDQGAGIGTLNVANFDQFLRAGF